MSLSIPNDVQEIMAEIAGIAFTARNPKTNKPIKFQISKGHSYIYFRAKSGNDYCYTPHPDLDGWFYSFAYVGVGAGSRIGKAKRFTMKHLRCHRKRKDARNRALKLRAAEHGVHWTENGLGQSDGESTPAVFSQ
jgi:hypothetical protein